MFLGKISGQRGGVYAEYVAVPADMLMPIPKGLSMEEAAALPEVFGAAYLFLFIEGRLKAGDTLLMMAGARRTPLPWE